jgi:hypothetical protein
MLGYVFQWNLSGSGVCSRRGRAQQVRNSNLQLGTSLKQNAYF